jgi:DNA-binding FadR family transcriptional regulator
MAEVVADRIRKLIARGELTEGDWLPTEPDLMTRFGVSRPTLREAFRLLEATGLIEIRRGPPGGARVRLPGPDAAAPIFGLLLTLSGTTLNDVYEARTVIEPAAARRLAEHGTEADHEELAAELGKVEASLDEPAGFAAATVRFHQRIVELSGNQTLALFIGMLGEVISQHLVTAYGESESPPAERDRKNRRALRAYQKLVDIVRCRDGAAAETFWTTHMESVRPHVLRKSHRQVVDVLS